MSDITYTRELNTNTSELVDEVYYNENTGDLYVDLDTAIYKYSNVPAGTADAFEAADSAGEFYNLTIKREYGPGENLGTWVNANYDEVEVLPKKVQTLDLTAPYDGELVTSGRALPITTTNGRFSLKPFADEKTAVVVEGVEREYIVTFEVDGLVDFRRHTLKSFSVDEAVKAVLDLGNMLDLAFVVREVTIKFA